MSNKKTLSVTGGKGFIGSNFLQRSNILDKYEVSAIVKNVNDNNQLKNNINFIEADLTNLDECKSIFKNFDIIFHCAGVGMTATALKINPFKGLLDNLTIHTNVIESIKNNPPSKFIWLSSTTGYPDSKNDLSEDDYFSKKVSKRYEIVGEHHRLMEIIINKISLGECNVITLRPTGVFGEGCDFSPDSSLTLPKIIRDCHLNLLPKTIFAQKEEKRNWIYVGDVIKALDEIITNVNLCITLNIGANKSISMYELYATILNYFKLANEHNLDTTNQFPDPPMARNIDCRRSIEYLGKYNSTTFNEGLIKTINWYQNVNK